MRTAQASRFLFSACALLAISGCQRGVLDPQGAVGSAEKTILIDSLAIMLTIVVPTIVATLAFALWYRDGNKRAQYRPEFVYSGRIEVIVWAIPLLTIILLGGVAWVGSHQLDPAEKLVSKNQPIDVQVVSLDWKWLFVYPEQHVASVNQLVVPAGVPIHFLLTSGSVLNTFFVPQLGSMIYTMNGMQTQLNLIADHPGTYPGLSGHFSGDGFPGMHFDVHAVPVEQFASWVETTRSNGPSLDAESYSKLARQSMDVQPFTYRDADPALFRKIVTQEVPPGPGPESGTPHPTSPPTGH